MATETYANFARDLCRELGERARTARSQRDKKRDDFNAGYLLAYYEVISQIQHKALAFGLSSADLGIATILPDRDLL